jgi:hypothetical protein
MVEIEKERAKDRQGQRSDLDEEAEDEHRGNVSTKSDDSKARDKAAEKVDADEEYDVE